MTVTSAKANTTHKDEVLKDNASIANKSFSHVNDNKNPAKQHVNTIPLYLLNGLDKWMRMINPTIDNKYVLAVPMSLSGKRNICANTTSAAMDANDVKDAGNARKTVCVIKWPDCLSSFASKARKKDGIPILNMDTNEICEGFKGYEKEMKIEKTANNK